jgi:hypothetical protein
MTDHANRYGPAIAEVLANTEPMPLGPAEQDPEPAALINALNVANAFAGFDLADRAMADACFAGLWLRANDLTHSHRISQGIDSPTGSYWHAIMHRREPDYSNAAYWFGKVGDHPIYPALCEKAAALAEAAGPPTGAAALARQTEWDPGEFIDFVRNADTHGGPEANLAVAIQDAEWWLLFDHSFEHAVGRAG